MHKSIHLMILEILDMAAKLSKQISMEDYCTSFYPFLYHSFILIFESLFTGLLYII